MTHQTKHYQINCCGKSPVNAPIFNIAACNEEDALRRFAEENADYSEQHIFDNFEAIEIGE